RQIKTIHLFEKIIRKLTHIRCIRISDISAVDDVFEFRRKSVIKIIQLFPQFVLKLSGLVHLPAGFVPVIEIARDRYIINFELCKINFISVRLFKRIGIPPDIKSKYYLLTNNLIWCSL